MKKKINRITWINRVLVSFTILLIGLYIYDADFLSDLIKIIIRLVVYQFFISIFFVFFNVHLVEKNYKILKRYNKIIGAYLLISVILCVVYNIDDAIFNIDALVLFYIVFCPSVIAIYFTVYLELIHKKTAQGQKQLMPKYNLGVNRIIIITWVNRILVSLPIIFFITLGVFWLIKLREDDIVGLSIFGMISMFVLGVFQIIVTIINTFYKTELEEKHQKMLSNYKKLVVFYIVLFIGGIFILKAINRYYNDLYNFLQIEDVVSKVYVLVCPILIAIYFTAYLERIKKEA